MSRSEESAAWSRAGHRDQDLSNDYEYGNEEERQDGIHNWILQGLADVLDTGHEQKS